MLTKRELSNAFRKIKKEFNLDSATTSTKCCNTCHSAEMYEKGIDRYIHVKYYTSGMNKDSVDFEDYNSHVISYSLEDIEEIKTLCERLNELIEKYGVEVEAPKDISRCIIIKNKERED